MMASMLALPVHLPQKWPTITTITATTATTINRQKFRLLLLLLYLCCSVVVRLMGVKRETGKPLHCKSNGNWAKNKRKRYCFQLAKHNNKNRGGVQPNLSIASLPFPLPFSQSTDDLGRWPPPWFKLPLQALTSGKHVDQTTVYSLAATVHAR